MSHRNWGAVRLMAGMVAVVLSPGILSGAPALAQFGQGGLVLTGTEGVKALGYKLDFGGVAEKIDRYRLDIPVQNVAVAEIQISGEQVFDGKFDPEEVRLEVEGQPVELSNVYWNPDFRSLEVVIKAPVASGQRMKLILSNVRNPSLGAIYRLTGRVLGTEANPIFRVVGNWLVTIEQTKEKTGI